MEKLKVDELRQKFQVPKKIKKKADMIAFIKRRDEPKSGPSLASIFTKQSSSNSCRLCSGETSVWCELGLIGCPLCQPVREVIKREFNDEVLNTEGVNLELVADLVLIKGFGICEAIDSLKQCDNDFNKSSDLLIDKTRRSAENYAFEQAQLNSEEAGQIARREEKKLIETNRNNVALDVSEFIRINPEFSEKYIFQTHGSNGLVEWLVSNALVVYDYLAIRKNAVKWYRKNATQYFEKLENQNLLFGPTEGYREWFTNQIAILREALYSIPESSGAIPLLFREELESTIKSDEDFEMLDLVTREVQVFHIDDDNV